MNETDAFHLTPLDIRKQEFRRALRGYETVGVEDFRERVADELERVIRERSVLEERVAALTEQLRVFRERERAMNDALLAAQQLRADIEQQAARQAETLVAQARVESERLLGDAQQQEASVRERAETARRQFHAYLGSLRSILERQLAELDGLDRQVAAAPPPVT